MGIEPMTIAIYYDRDGRHAHVFKDVAVISISQPAYIKPPKQPCHHCHFHDDCHANVAKGGMALCETGIVAQMGDLQVTL